MITGPGRVETRPVPDHRPARGGWWSVVVPDPVCVAVAGVLLAAAVAIGWSAAADVRLPVDREVLRAADLDLVLAIAGRNAIVAATLFSGVATAGISTLVALPVLGIYVGVVFRVAVGALGGPAAAALLVPFVVLELAAFVLAAACGLGPARVALCTWRSSGGAAWSRIRSATTAYLGSAGSTLYRVPLVGALLLVAALVEAWSGVPL